MRHLRLCIVARAFALLAVSLAVMGCADRPSRTGGASGSGDADQHLPFVLFMYRKDLREQTSLSRDQRSALKDLEREHRYLVEIETHGPGSKRSPVPFDLLRRPGDSPEQHIRRRWASFGRKVHDVLNPEQRKTFLASGLEAPSIKAHPRGDGYILSWKGARGDASTTTNVAESIRSVDHAITNLSAKDHKRQREALDYLAGVKPNDRDHDRVMAAVKRFVNATNHMRVHSYRVAGNWAKPADAKLLLGWLDRKEREPRDEAVRALVRLNHPAIAREIAKRLDDFFFRSRAFKALQATGGQGEAVAIQLLDHTKKHNGPVCHILAKIGGKKTVVALRAKLKANDPSIDRAAAEGAIAAIEKRLSTTADSAKAVSP